MIPAMKQLLATALAGFAGQAFGHDWDIQHAHFSPEVLLFIVLVVAVAILRSK